MICAGDINWEGFTFQHGFRILRPRYEAVQISPVPGADGPAPTAGAKSEAGGTPVKVPLQPTTASLTTSSSVSLLRADPI